MERITAINADRLVWSVHERGIDLPQLASAVDISERTLVDAIQGKQGLTFNQLQKIAAFFNCGVLFFFEPGVPQQEHVYSPQFRTLANQHPEMTQKVRALIQRVERQRTIYLGLREELGEPAGRFEPPKVGPTDIPGAASQVRAWLGLNERNSFETYRAAIEEKHVLVFRTNGYNGAWQIPKNDPIEGFCLFEPVSPVIVVKKHRAEARQNFTLFHELGHLVLHRSSHFSFYAFLYDQAGYPGDIRLEREANLFAGHLLVPDEFLDRIDRREMPRVPAGFDDWLRPYRASWSVSTEVILRRLLDKGWLSNDEYQAFRSWRAGQKPQETPGGSREYRHREPLHVFGPTFTRAVLESLEREQITSNKASRYLDNLKLKDLRQLEAYIATH